MASVLFGLSMAVLVYATLQRPPQRQADRRIIVIKPKAENVFVCVDVPVHSFHLFAELAAFINKKGTIVKKKISTAGSFWPK
jgi:hypothetical protein